MLAVLGLAAVAFAASVISGVAGFGGAMIFLPFLVAAHGERAAVPILTVAVLLGNGSRVWFNRRDLRRELVAAFSLGAVPAAVLGSWLYVSLSPAGIRRGIGAFLIASVLYQRLRRPVTLANPWFFTPLGAVSGFLSALVGGIGPLSAPFFLAYGLAKEAFVGTEALCAFLMHLTKLAAYRKFDVLGNRDALIGLGYGLVMTLGSYAAKNILERMSRERFVALVEALLVIVGIYMLFSTTQ